MSDVPSLIPSQVRFVQQNAHQLGHRKRGVRIIQLDGGSFSEGPPISIATTESPDQIGKRAGHQKILLYETECLPPDGGVIRVQDPSEGLGGQCLSQSSDKVPAAELLKVK